MSSDQPHFPKNRIPNLNPGSKVKIINFYSKLSNFHLPYLFRIQNDTFYKKFELMRI